MLFVEIAKLSLNNPYFQPLLTQFQSEQFLMLQQFTTYQDSSNKTKITKVKVQSYKSNTFAFINKFKLKHTSSKMIKLQVNDHILILSCISNNIITQAHIQKHVAATILTKISHKNKLHGDCTLFDCALSR
jgi:hypothetical protein